MSLLPVHSFPAALFIEARIVGPSARSIVSQLGVSLDAPDCSVAVFSRASGVLLVAGVGSYCAYRICTKFLGQRFVYMLLEASHVDHLATADRRLLYNQTEAANEDAVEDEEQDDNEWMERVSSAAGSQFSRMSRFRHSASRGLFAIRSRPRSREGVLSRRSNSGKTLSIAGSGTSVGSGRSASLQIVWEGNQQWDDEFAEAPGTMVSTSRSARILPVGNPRPDLAAPSIGDLCSVFDDVMSVVSAVDNTDDPLMFQQHGDPDEEDVVNCTIKCMTDSKYMYRSVLDDDIASEAGSMISRRSSLMRLSNARRMTAASTGLWSLASEEPSTSKGLLEISQTESTMTKSFNSKRSSNNRSMFDSAIGADLSSEEGSLDLNKLEPLSENGMEWCDDDLLPIPSSRNGFDWDMESTREGVTVSPLHRPNSSRDLMAFACQRYPPCSPQFKLLHTLYHRNRLRRIGCSTEETMAGQKQLELLLQAALYHRRRIVQDMTWLELEQRLEQRFGECDFLQRWPGRTKRDLQRYLRLLWDLIEFTGCGVEEGHIKGLEVLLVMESIEVYNEKMARGLTDWFEHDSPSTILERIHNGASLDSTSWTLASRCFDTSIEIIDVSLASQQPKYTTYGTSSATLHWLKYGASPVPLFLVPEF